MAQSVKTPPEMRETACNAGELGSPEDLLEKEMAALSSILAWEISWTEAPDQL